MEENTKYKSFRSKKTIMNVVFLRLANQITKSKKIKYFSSI